jgi:hypothetical protein
MADQIRNEDEQKKNTAEPLDEQDLDQVSGGGPHGGVDGAIKIDLGPHGPTTN